MGLDGNWQPLIRTGNICNGDSQKHVTLREEPCNLRVAEKYEVFVRTLEDGKKKVYNQYYWSLLKYFQSLVL